nr:ribonuclease H-like domain-containing protein [Tanacetum cinerariifolium]
SKILSKLLESQGSDKTGLGFNSQVFRCQVSDCEELYSHNSDNRVPKNLENNRYNTGEGYHAVPPSYTGTFLPPNLIWEFVKKVEHNKQAKNLRKNNRKSRGKKINWNNKACFVCGSFNYLIKDCDYYEKQMVQKPVWNNAMRVNHQNLVRMTLPHQNRNVVPTIVLTRSRLMSLNAVKIVPTAVTQSTIKSTWPVKHVVNKAHSPVKRPINQRTTTKNSNFNKKVTNVKVNKVNDVQGNKGNAEKTSAYWVWKLKCKVLDYVSRLTSTSMTLKKFDYTDALGRSKSVMAWVPKRN